jgi:hypothetical protein
MGATPDTSITLTGGTLSADDAGAVVVQVWRGVDPTTPFDVTQTTATGTNSVLCDPPAITPVTPGAVIVSGGAGGHNANTIVTGVYGSSEGGYGVFGFSGTGSSGVGVYGNSTLGFGGDFDVIYKHFSLNSDLDRKYPRIQKARLVKLFLKNMEIGEYDQMSKMLEWNLDLESKSDYILYNMSRSRSIPEELVDKLLNYPTFNINTSISERSGLVVAIREHNNILADKMLSNGRFDYDQKGEGGINLFNELVTSSGLKSTPSILDAFGITVLSRMDDSKIGGEGVRHMMLKNIIKSDMLRTLEYLVSSNIEMPYNRPYSILFDIIRLMEEHISKKESVLPKMFRVLVNSGKVDINATHFSMKETVLQYITRITKYMDKSGNGYKYLNDCANALINAGAH